MSYDQSGKYVLLGITYLKIGIRTRNATYSIFLEEAEVSWCWKSAISPTPLLWVAGIDTSTQSWRLILRYCGQCLPFAFNSFTLAHFRMMRGLPAFILLVFAFANIWRVVQSSAICVFLFDRYQFLLWHFLLLLICGNESRFTYSSSSTFHGTYYNSLSFAYPMSSSGPNGDH